MSRGKDSIPMAPPPLGQLIESENRLQRDFSDLSRAWNDVKGEWFDGQRDRFERQHLASLGPSLSRMCAALHDFQDAANQASRDLADPDDLSSHGE